MLQLNENEQQRVNSALEQARIALANHRKQYDDISSARVLNEIGKLHLDLQQLGQAEVSLRSAFMLAQRTGDARLRANVQINRAKLALAQKQHDMVYDCCDDALYEYSRMGYEVGLSEIYLIYGILFRESSEGDLAGAHFALAARLAKAAGHLVLEADALKEHARLHIQEARFIDGIAAIDAAAAILLELPESAEAGSVGRRLRQLERMRNSIVVRQTNHA